MEARYQYETSPRKIQQYEKNDRKNKKIEVVKELPNK